MYLTYLFTPDGATLLYTYYLYYIVSAFELIWYPDAWLFIIVSQ